MELQSQTEFKEQVAGQIDQILGLVFVLLLLAVVIAVIGIINTLALSVFERTRELGLLRAVGMGRRQVRRMIRWESIIIAVLGAVLGLGVGAFFGWAAVSAMKDIGVDRLDFPVGRLLCSSSSPSWPGHWRPSSRPGGQPGSTSSTRSPTNSPLGAAFSLSRCSQPGT